MKRFFDRHLDTLNGSEGWLRVAQEVLDGRHDQQLKLASHRKSLIIGLRGVDHPLCRKAILVLQPDKQA